MNNVSPEPSTPSPARRPRSGWRALVGWIAPFALAGLAFNVHAQLHIPRGELPPPKPKKKKKKKKPAKAKRSRSTPSRTIPGKSAANKRVAPLETARPARELDALWRRYGAKPYQDEPIDAPWDAAHRPLVHRLAASAREHTFAGSPETPSLTISSTACRTIRCELIIHGPSHEVLLYSETLRGLKLDDQPLLRALSGQYTAIHKPAELTSASPRDASALGPIFVVRFELAFTTDLPDLAALGLRPAPLGPDRTLGTSTPSGDSPAPA